MKIITDRKFHIEEATAVAIGKFDSLHLGHQLILKKLKEDAGDTLKTLVVSFSPSPEVYFKRGSSKFALTEEEKQKNLEAYGIDYYVLFPFDKQTAELEPEEFLEEILLGQMNMKLLVAGDDLSFGKGAHGNVDFVMEKSVRYGFRVHVCPKLQYDGREISATYVRESLMEGDLEKCLKLLGHDYEVEGIVEQGTRLGRTLNVPTCNIITNKEKLLPPKGVYFTEVTLDEKKYYGVTNVGTKPTVSEEGRMGVETHLLDFDEDVYGKELKVKFRYFHRPERKFESVDALKLQLQDDIAQASAYFKKDAAN